MPEKKPWFPETVNSGWAITAFVVGIVLGAILSHLPF